MANKSYMNWAILSALLLLCAGLCAAYLALLRQVTSARDGLPITTEWINELSIERYRPMMRLLDQQETELLESQPGFTPQRAARLRRQRCQVFREYLHDLRGDFGRVSMAMGVLMTQSRHDRPDLARALIQRRLVFAMGLAVIRMRLLLYCHGYCRVDGSALVQTFDALRLELQRLMPRRAQIMA
jgi:hypothetical protein